MVLQCAPWGQVSFLRFPLLRDIDTRRARHRASRKIKSEDPAPFVPYGKGKTK